MAKTTKAVYVCDACGATTGRWAGKCPDCGEWNSLVEKSNVGPPPGSGLGRSPKSSPIAKLEDLATPERPIKRISTGLDELNRVTGGGIVPGSAILVGGEPGVGKSTLLLQVAATLGQAGQRVMYFCGEEAPEQVRMRANRLALNDAPVLLAAETNLGSIIATLSQTGTADLVIIDSIQTLWSEAFEAAPGTLSQVRAASQSLVRFAKQAGSAIVLVGHITKEGQIAGPKVIEHLVDTVLYFEGDRGHSYRLLRSFKNRFGATDEIGVFEMTEAGLSEVRNPSELFLGNRNGRAPGAAVYAGVEGTRPILVEFQALVAPSPLGTPRRAAVGWENNRLAMLLAVLDARCGISFAKHDVYLNVAGGLKITDPAADLAAAAALISSFSNQPLPHQQVHFGEISLSGAVRPTSHISHRLKEAHKLGFQSAVLPAAGEIDVDSHHLQLTRVEHLKDLAIDTPSCQ
ncbi:MAG: DNA repair protein RadA [Hyphomicrobiaceae bacterium]